MAQITGGACNQSTDAALCANCGFAGLNYTNCSNGIFGPDTVVHIYSNKFANPGTISSWYGQLAGLQTLTLTYSYTGTIPTELGMLVAQVSIFFNLTCLLACLLS
jgi:hypothetical protein